MEIVKVRVQRLGIGRRASLALELRLDGVTHIVTVTPAPAPEDLEWFFGDLVAVMAAQGAETLPPSTEPPV